MKLLLAVDIADRLRDAERDRTPFDLETEARALLERHPEAHASIEDVVVTMRSQMRGRTQCEPAQ